MPIIVTSKSETAPEFRDELVAELRRRMNIHRSSSTAVRKTSDKNIHKRMAVEYYQLSEFFREINFSHFPQVEPNEPVDSKL